MPIQKVLAISGFNHEASIAYFSELGLKYLELERLNRKKYSGFDDVESIKTLLAELGAKLEDADKVILVNTDTYYSPSIRREKIKEWYDANVVEPKRFILDHHTAHQSAAYFTSNFDSAIILSADDVGDGISAALSTAKGNKLERVMSIPAELSLGRFWEGLNILLGYEGPNDSGKTMALSAFGKNPKYISVLNNLVGFNDGEYFLNLDGETRKLFADTFRGNQYIARYLSAKTGLQLLKDFSRLGSPDLQDYYDMALSMQEFTNQFIAGIIQPAIKNTGITNVCLAGGVALNGVCNNYLLEHTDTRALHLNPASSDCGLSIGGLLYYLNQDQSFRLWPFAPFGGVSYEGEILSALKASGLSYSKISDAPREAAKKLAEGKIVGWYQGSSEIGPRALGNRSILADPRSYETKDKINKRIKFREDYRPFAPAVMAERAKDYFDFPAEESPYMLLISRVKPGREKEIPAVVHYDGTARLQTVSKEQNPLLHNVLREFCDITGAPVLLNTSFNGPGEPIVNKPEEAIAFFKKSELDCLIIGDYLVQK